MSLADSWKKYLESLNLRMDHSEVFRREIAERKRAFYSGAEAVNNSLYDGPNKEIQAEIDHFRSRK